MRPSRAGIIGFIILALPALLAVSVSVPAKGGDDIGDRIVGVAEGQIGKHDKDGGLIGLYHGHKQAWCSEFVCWCYRQAGAPMQRKFFSLTFCTKKWNLANAPSIIEYFRKNYRYFDIEEFPDELAPRAGDYAFVTDTKGERSHSAIVKAVRKEDDGTETLITVEGNNRGRAVDVYEYPDWRHQREGKGVIGGIGLRW